MSQDILNKIQKFMDDFDEADEKEDAIPVKDMLKEIRNDLETIHDKISSNGYSLGEKTDSMGKLVDELNKLLQECLDVLKKHRGSTRICLNYFSPAQLSSLRRWREKLLTMKKEFKDMLSELRPLGEIIGKPLQWTYGDVDESKIFGWDELAKEIINKSLLKENKDSINVVGIVGMFGSGKTSLAQKIYLSDEVIDHFPLRLWVWVSEECDKEELIRRTLDNLGVDEDHIDKMLNIDPKLDKVGVLLFLLHLELSKRRYLIVFDDVVNIEPWHCELEKDPPGDVEKEWTDRLAYGLPKGDGSAIIITSRNEDGTRKMVGQAQGDIYYPKPLLGKDGWDLFKASYEEAAKMKFNDQKLESLLEEITEKCAGLPLALKAAGERMGRKESEAIKAEASSRPNKQENEAEASSRPTKQENEAEASSHPNKQEIEDEPSSPPKKQEIEDEASSAPEKQEIEDEA